MVNGKTLETIERMKLLVLKRCEERVQNASGSMHSKPPERSTYVHCHGVTAILRHRHGL
jgi:hypothetical protein